MSIDVKNAQTDKRNSIVRPFFVIQGVRVRPSRPAQSQANGPDIHKTLDCNPELSRCRSSPPGARLGPPWARARRMPGPARGPAGRRPRRRVSHESPLRAEAQFQVPACPMIMIHRKFTNFPAGRSGAGPGHDSESRSRACAGSLA